MSLAILVTPLIPVLLAAVQDQQPDRKTVTVKIEVAVPGGRVPRLPGQGERSRSNDPFRLVDRVLRWRIGPFETEVREDFGKELARVLGENSTWRQQPGRPKETIPPRVVIQPSSDALWNDVVSTVSDLTAAAGTDFHIEPLHEIPLHLMATLVDDPIREEGGFVVPKDIYNRLDDQPRRPPTIVIRQDGRVQHRGETLLDSPRKSTDDSALLRRIQVLADESLKREGLVQRAEQGDKPLLDEFLMIYADKWARWSDVSRVIHAARSNQPAFYKIGYAVSDSDLEEQPAKRERRP